MKVDGMNIGASALLIGPTSPQESDEDNFSTDGTTFDLKDDTANALATILESAIKTYINDESGILNKIKETPFFPLLSIFDLGVGFKIHSILGTLFPNVSN
ncbi:hypothetical protein FACS189496_5280 [Bacilli bacterium]|nr:hypothetical protein FACS189496_5280 [Bacilli bacterium]